MDKKAISQYMSELGRRSVEARRKKNPNYWDDIRPMGAEARRKKNPNY